MKLFLYDKETLMAVLVEKDKNKAEKLAEIYLNLGLNVRSEDL